MKVSKVLWNLLGGCVAVLLISYTFEQKGYQFVWSMLRRNWKVANEYKGLSLSDRYQMKLGNGYAVYKYVCDKTPEDAIIYIPAAKYFQQEGVEGEPWNKLWAMRFLYPRQVVQPHIKSAELGLCLPVITICNRTGRINIQRITS